MSAGLTPLAELPPAGGELQPIEPPPLQDSSPALEPLVPRPAWPDKPWLSIWTEPRRTIRAIVDVDPTRHVLLLAALGNIVITLDRASASALGDTWPIWAIVLLTVIMGGLGGIIGVYIGGAIFYWTGTWLGGQARPEQVRAALAWSLVPRIAGVLLWIPYLALFGEEMFTSDAPRIVSHPELYFVLSMLGLALGLWTLFLMVKTVSEVHRFSAWRGLAALAIPFVALIGLMFGCILLVGL